MFGRLVAREENDNGYDSRDQSECDEEKQITAKH
jgi:hypothetical protein